MKGMNKDELKKVAYNCRKATMLIEKKQLTHITKREELELKLHLAGCSVCRLFEQQSTRINHLYKSLFSSSAGNIKLDDSFKNTLQNKIDEKMRSK